MKNLKLYKIKDEYIEYLLEYDKNVRHNKKESRPYIGIVLEINNRTYYAPLSSPKEKHRKIKKNQKDVYKIDDGELGIINLNNMIPVSNDDLIEMNIETEKDEKYKNILTRQYNIIRKDKDEILKKANKLYKILRKIDKDTSLYKRCCNFIMLEEKVKEYLK